jgi:2-keto-4-pentenoate hydratase/2-oxohepta-3-ene-1,7-dioic acid hydratase in catechol pathway
MKLLTFVPHGPVTPPRIGAWQDGGIIDLEATHARFGDGIPFPHALTALIGDREGLARAEQLIAAAADSREGDGIRLAGSAVRLLPPIPDPGKFFCVGKNNKSHLEELVRNQLINEIPQEPTGFVKVRSAIVGDDAEVERPSGIATLDYEPELVFVIGRRAFRTPAASALDHVMGITLTNDLTAREIQKREVASGTRFWTAKNMPGFGPVGPVITTLDEIRDPHDLWITLSVNGKQRLRVHTGDVIFRIGDVLEHFSRWMPFEPGDMIAMGAPAGVAVGQPNAADLYLRPDDTVEVAFEGQSPTLRTRIIAPKEQQQ